jgi:gas vesicle protein
MNGIKVLAGMVAGIAIGTVIGVLTAPDRGDKTRKKLDQEATKIRDNFNKALKESMDTFKTYIQQTGKELSEDLKKGRARESQMVKENKA